MSGDRDTIGLAQNPEADGGDGSGETKKESHSTVTKSAESEKPDLMLRPVNRRQSNRRIRLRPSRSLAPRVVSTPATERRSDLSGIETRIKKLVEDLKSDSIETQRQAAAELRFLAKDMDNRIVIASCDAISVLVGLLSSEDTETQEHAVTGLLNLSISDNNKTTISNADSIKPLIQVLKTGSPEARQNSAATLYSLSRFEDNKIRIVSSGAIPPLVDLLANGSLMGKKDAVTALLNLSMSQETRASIVQSGAVEHLVELLDPATGLVDRAIIALANLATIPEGRDAIVEAKGIPVLVEVVELGSARVKEIAAAALFQLCQNDNKCCKILLREDAIPPLVILSQSGTRRAKEKATNLLKCLRCERLCSRVKD